jgi:hypothetical protein
VFAVYIHKSDGTPGVDAGTSGFASFRRVTLGVLEYCEEGMLTLNSGSSHSASAGCFTAIVRVMSMPSLRSVEQEEIDTAGELWAAYEGPHRRKLKLKGSPIRFVRTAQRWLRFHGQLAVPAPHPFHQLITEFIDAMRSTRGFAAPTAVGYSSRAIGFLKWFGERHDNLGFVSLRHIDEFMIKGDLSQTEGTRSLSGARTADN